ncbi:hypothetical protein DPMN_044960 [Dreissena polymorpha]|uniref:Uncharacterized protein n=1 Tax=Dreissena polymorpha TaxID=45954 RepID=A0A9D4I0Y1_DREPO|nr:hypothetical protein DPMN_044960 [Dreissena polymorpha]
MIKKNVTSRVFTSFFYYINIRKKTPPPLIHREKTAPSPGGHVFQMFTTIFKLVRDAKNVTSRIPPFLAAMFFLPIRTIFELNSRIQETNVLTKCHEDWTKNVTSRVENCPAPWTIFELIRDINETNVLTKFHDDWAKLVTSRVFTRNTAPPTGGHVFQRTGAIFKLNQHINKTNILAKFT